MNILDLEKYRTEGSKVFFGRDRGLDIRKRAKLGQMLRKYKEVIVIIPANLYSIGASFFEELFCDAVQDFGKEGFYNKVKFINEGTYNYENSLTEAIDRLDRLK